MIWMLTSGMSYRPRSHHRLFLFLEFTNWAMFLAVWIALAVNIGRKDWCVDPDGSHSRSRECDTIYAAWAFAIVEWILFTATLAGVGMAVSRYRGTSPAVHEKNASTGGTAVRPSDDGTVVP